VDRHSLDVLGCVFQVFLEGGKCSDGSSTKLKPPHSSEQEREVGREESQLVDKRIRGFCANRFYEHGRIVS
jgi:hypothetical protein